MISLFKHATPVGRCAGKSMEFKGTSDRQTTSSRRRHIRGDHSTDNEVGPQERESARYEEKQAAGHPQPLSHGSYT